MMRHDFMKGRVAPIGDRRDADHSWPVQIRKVGLGRELPQDRTTANVLRGGSRQTMSVGILDTLPVYAREQLLLAPKTNAAAPGALATLAGPRPARTADGKRTSMDLRVRADRVRQRIISAAFHVDP